MNDATLTTTLCEIVGDLPGFEWNDDGAAYATGSVGVFYGRIEDNPDRAVGVRVYDTFDEPGLHRRRVQFWIRGARGERASADLIADAVFARLDKLSREGGISAARRESMSVIGADDNDREQRSENYTITLDNEEAQ